MRTGTRPDRPATRSARQGWAELSPQKKPITDEQAKEICRLVETKFLKLSDACNLMEVHPVTFRTNVCGDKPRHPEWRQWWDKAKASAVAHWIEMGAGYAKENNNAGVKFVNNMLMALDRSRFRDDKGKAQGQVVVNIIQGGTAELKINEVEILEGRGELQITEGEG